MNIKTGKGVITLTALVGIWSVSALTSLPGLAISPILDDLSHIFTHASDLDIEMLTSLPSLMIIPFILLAGWLTEHLGYMRLLYWGLGLFALCGVLYFFCDSINELLLVSALLGIGAGIIIPLSTYIISYFFDGEYRTQQFGYSSAINNVTLVVATVAVGYLADIKWRFPFVVYLLPFLSLLLMPFVARAGEKVATAKSSKKSVSPSVATIQYRPLMWYILYYFLVTYLVMAVGIDLPFLMGEYSYSSGSVGVVTSIFYLAIMLPGFFLNPIMRFLKGRVTGTSLMMIALGLLLVYVSKEIVLITIGCFVAGSGYGIAQPYIYDRSSQYAPPQKTAFALGLVMTMNYVAILLYPFIIDFFQKIMHISSQRFSFGFNSLLAFAVLFFLLLYRVNSSSNEKQ